MLESIAAVDANRTENTYSMLRVMIWAIPIIGFIGTVVGLGGAVGGFSESLPKATDFGQLKDLLGGVTSGLSVAFDATFVALLISILLMFPASWLEKKELDLLSDIDEYCQDKLVSWFGESSARPTTGTNTKELSKELTTAFEQVLQVQQKQFQEYWRQINEAVAQRLTVTTNAVASSVQKIVAAAEKFTMSIESAAEKAAAIAAPLAKAKESADGISECMNMARGESEALRDAVQATVAASEKMKTAWDQSATSASESEAAAKAVAQHLVQAREAAEKLKSEVEQAMKAAAERCGDEVESRIGEIRSHADTMDRAAEGLRHFVAHLTPRRSNADGKGG